MTHLPVRWIREWGQDGGLTWVQQASPVSAWLSSVVFDKSGRGWITADDELLLSDDGGDTWRALSVEGKLFLRQVVPVKDSLWAVGQFGVLRQVGGKQGFATLATLPGANRAGGGS